MGPVVLIAEESRELRRLMRAVVSRLGEVEIIEAEDGVGAVYRLAERDFQADLALISWTMPRLSGKNLARRLKAHPHLSRLPLLMLIGPAEEKELREVVRSGVDGCLLKPFTQDMFLEAVLSLRPGSHAPTAAASGPGETTAGPRRSFIDELPEEAYSRLMAQLKVEEIVGATEPFLKRGESVDNFCCVLDGQVEESWGEGWEAPLVRVYGPGDCFAVIELMAGCPLEREFSAHERAVIGRLAAPDFNSLIMQFPAVNLALSRFVALKSRERLVASRAAVKAREEQRAKEAPEPKPETAAAAAEEDGGEKDMGEIGLSGSLSVLDLPNLIQTLGARGHSGVIDLPDIQATIELDTGQVTRAATPQIAEDGQAAFLDILRSEPKKFYFRVGRPSPRHNVSRNTTMLLFDCLRQLDEGVPLLDGDVPDEGGTDQ